MKNFVKKVSVGIISILSVLGININIGKAAIPKHLMEIKANSPLYLEHGSNIFQQNIIDKTQMVTEHYSHMSHYSHSSHHSHYSHSSHHSHYSSW